MAEQLAVKTDYRLRPQPNELIDREKTVRFSFNGKQLTAFKGDTIASALAANGVSVIGRSFKYHRPRGLIGHGHSISAMVQIGNEPSVSVWLRKVEQGMAVRSVNVWPSLDRDLMSLTGLGDRFMPVGFYYKTFIRPQSLWPTYEKVLRRAAGLGKIDTTAHLTSGYDKQYLHGDVVVVGAGPAGLGAALGAAEQGARVLLFEEAPYLGGHLRYSNQHQEALAELIDAVQAHKNIDVYTDTLINGQFEQNFLFAVRGKRLFKVRGKATVFATGAEDQPLIFNNNDVPGVMLGSAIQRLMHLYGVVPGQRVLVVTANEDGWQLAAELQAAGVAVAAIVDQREAGSAEHSLKGVSTYNGCVITDAVSEKGQRVKSAKIAPITADGLIQHNLTQELHCDVIAVSTAWTPNNSLLYQAGASIAYNDERQEFLAHTLPDGIFAAGRVLGTHSAETQIDEGRYAGQSAAAFVGLGEKPKPQTKAALTRKRSGEPRRTSVLNHIISPNKGKRFVDLDEDVTDVDVKMAIAEGYNSIELLKRYSTISMGPSQGRWSSINTIHLTSRENNWTIPETGTTTSRPPYRPLELRALAGQMMEPVRYTSIQPWHNKNGAKMMVSGVWMRPEHFGAPESEVRAVRERVGMIDVSTLGKIKLTGPGVPNLLDKLYVNRWQNLRVGRVRYGIMCTAEGVVMDDGVTARISEDEYYMTTTSGGAGSVFEWIQWWVQSGWGEGVHVTSASEGRAAFNLAGPKSRELLLDMGVSPDEISNEAFPYMRVRELEIAGVPCRVMRIGFTGELSYEIHAPSSFGLHVWEAIMAAGKAHGIRPFGMEAQRILRLEKAHIIVGQDTDALADPISADQAWAVKLDKDDFLGQRALTRVAQNGPVQKLVGFTMQAPGIVPEEGLQIVEHVPQSETRPLGLEVVGWVTSSRHSPTLKKTIGLCWLPTAVAEQEGASFNIRRNGELIRGRVHHGPFYDVDGGLLRS